MGHCLPGCNGDRFHGGASQERSSRVLECEQYITDLKPEFERALNWK